jgi:hypothetical protein
MEYLAMIGSDPRLGGDFLLKCPFIKTDAGRSTSKRPRQSNDCTVRALALAADAEYDTAYDTLAEAGRKCARGFDFRTWAKTAEFNGYRFTWTSFPAVKDKIRETPVTFALAHSQGRFILRCSKHVLVCIDGTVMDVTQYQGVMGLEYRCVYAAWHVVKQP